MPGPIGAANLGYRTSASIVSKAKKMGEMYMESSKAGVRATNHNRIAVKRFQESQVNLMSDVKKMYNSLGVGIGIDRQG
jgi:hypothetical protein